MNRDIDKLKKWIINKREQGLSVTDICYKANISRDMFYRWWNRYQSEGVNWFIEKPKGRSINYSVDDALKEKIIELRKKRNWGPCRIEGYFNQKGINVPHNRIYKIICAAGLNQPISGVRKTWGKKRFERMHSNSLWQADWKLCSDDYWMITFLDDHSRFIVGSKRFWDPTTENVLKVLFKAVKRYEWPGQILTDRGTQFYCNKGEGESLFTKTCEENGSKHIVASKRRPTTTGKVERWHRSYEEEHKMFKSLKEFVRYYNYERPHQGINYLTPAKVYFRDKV